MSEKQDFSSLLYQNKTVAELYPEKIEEAQSFCGGYQQFLNEGKTEREAAAAAVRLLKGAGYVEFTPKGSYRSGQKVYRLHRGKCVLAATIGTLPMEEGLHINAAHIDSPRLDLKPVPLYESDNLALLQTHYYGGLRKYQWATIPLALHGVVVLADGKTVNICIGEDEQDPVFCITDLLPHLSAAQNERRLPEGIKGEELNLLAGALPLADTDEKEKVKLNVLYLLNRKYGITERDFVRAELEVVPAFKARDVGIDRSMIGAYGQDDRVDAYPALAAEIETKLPRHTTVCILTDKEEIGSEGVTGLAGEYYADFIRQLCTCQGADYITVCANSVCLSADVTAAYDPTWKSAFEADNACYIGNGIAICKYTGARGKSGASDASAELVGYLTNLLDRHKVVWQIGEMGKVDQGGGGTVAKFVAARNIPTIDIGVPVLSMHSPYEVVHKADVYMAYLAFVAFNQD